MTSSSTNPSILIIGAGLSGLTLARSLKHYQPIILEARHRLGGRAYSVPLGAGDHDASVDMGCAMVHGWNEGNPVRDLIHAYGGNAQVVPKTKNIIISSTGPLDFSQTEALQYLSSKHAFSRSSDSSPTQERARGFGESTTEWSGITLEQTSAKWFGFARNCFGTDALPERGYSTEVVDRLAEEVRADGGRIELGINIVTLEDLGSEKGVRVTSQDGQEWTADYVVSTIPLGVLQQGAISFSPALPRDLRMAIQRTAVGVLEKVVLTYDETWWTESEQVGGFTLLPTAEDRDLSRAKTPKEILERTTLAVQSLYRIASTPTPTLLVYLGADSGRRLIEDHSKETIAQAVHDYFITRIPVAKGKKAPAQAKHSVISDWVKDPFSSGATSTPVSLNKSEDGEAASPIDFVILSRSIWEGRLGFAGEHSEMDHRGSVVGALVSGEREATRLKEVLERRAQSGGATGKL
ncbi:BZ3500_MvSof-1268-A1-R1_Chr5-2g07917 [Microbotryum saponariae]|uniref:BZ3500_MvSof-1268-A1-R1_Chr5-2g07917 protein n=1 Tax=Microbotryum saponariae TaxID=289078 RepID=A0A2X0KGV2_9BASI|nr:BZ3500_MvSof-1268-A1-R1_Chr5-2g07917 [Microbotryum saponariae]SDA05786.1 BZ3501_MvSof-1269-A2-R1_Chr5-2g07739 [Microbotryum saponariae]